MLKTKKVLSSILIGLISISTFANESSQSHQQPVSIVSSIIDINGESSVFSAGDDGFLIKWNDSDLGEHYQITDLAIKNIAQSPNGKDVAVYETDGATFNRVTVWTWENEQQTKKIAYRFNDSITSLSFSAKGTYIICGTTAVNGAYFINAKSGNIEKGILKENTGTFSYASTSDTEKTFVIYSPIGSIAYYDLSTGEKKKKFDVEANLTKVCMFNKSLFLAGIKNKTLYILHAFGKTLGTFSVNNAILIGNNTLESLYYISNENRQFKLYEIKSENGKTISSPTLLRTFSGLKNNEKIVSATISGNNIYAGTTKGNIYKFDYEQTERVDVIQPITDDQYDKVLDIDDVQSENSNNFFILTPNSIYKTDSTYESVEIIRKCDNPGYKNLLTYGDEIILWSKDSKESVIKLNPETNTQSKIFTPKGTIQSLKLFNNTLLTIESNSNVCRYDIISGKQEILYQGTSIQDAVLYSDNDLYVAKSSATSPNAPLIYINTKTQETVPTTLDGTFAYALNYNSSKSSEIYGLIITSGAKENKTSIFSYNPKTKLSKTILTMDNEDTSAFMILNWPSLYTNVGKSETKSYNLMTKRNFIYNRSESMPLKVVRNNNNVVVLNRNGSISWYKSDNKNIKANYYLYSDGQWYEL